MKYRSSVYLVAALLAASCSRETISGTAGRSQSALIVESHAELKEPKSKGLLVISDRYGICLPKEFAAHGTYTTRRDVLFSYGEYVFVENDQAHKISFMAGKTVGPPGIKLEQSEASDPTKRFFEGEYDSTRVLSVESLNSDEGSRLWFEFKSDDQVAEKEAWRLARGLIRCEIVAKY
ncbi:MAG TPA: hypothetical protein VKM35_04800 [Arenimonas sp.]|uniref:hypothetical protein n=1 Tax=Arenimonas sp. TaxID=1872635 RepID=UPI002BA320F8|nr:hypothetical protein [Arenimonas sp.]HMB56508.1 hypothetical protein [Arenimonas sp.]